LVFIGMGFYGITASRNMASMARYIEIQNGEVSVRFWWRWRRGELRFAVRDVVEITYCGIPKGKGPRELLKRCFTDWRYVIESFSRAPTGPCCYSVQVRGQKDFYITGKEERVLEAVQRLELERGRQQAAQAGWAEPAQPNE
jgi:hypothetical protein